MTNTINAYYNFTHITFVVLFPLPWAVFTIKKVYLQFDDVKPRDVKSFSKSLKTIKECLEKKPTETDHQKVYGEEVNDLKDRINDFLSVSTLIHDITYWFNFSVRLCQSIVLHF